MKILITTSLDSDLSPKAWFSLPDSSLANAGKPLYLPHLGERFEAFPVWGVKVSKLGKSVAAKFAPRYYSQIVPALLFRASDLYCGLKAEGLPTDRAWDFDRSMIAAPAVEAADFFLSMPLRLFKNGIGQSVRQPGNPEELVAKALEKMSETNIVKIGDLIVPSLPEPTEISIGDSLVLADGHGELLRVDIK